VEPTNQSAINDRGDKLAIENNIDAAKRNMLSLQTEANSLKQQQRLTEDAISSLDSQRAALIQAGADPSSREVREIQKQIEQQIEISSVNDAVIDQLNSQFAGLNNNLTRLNSQYNSL
jgi:chromosome segregation ATPase